MNRKSIMQLVKAGIAYDLTGTSRTDLIRLIREHKAERIATATGRRGQTTAILLRDMHGNLYAITERNSNLYTAY